jgi:hypothetical protein
VSREKRDELIDAHPSSAEVIKPFLRGRDIKRWRVEFEEQYLLYVPWHFPLHNDPTIVGASKKAEKAFAERYPAIFSHLKSFKNELSARNAAETGIRYEWYALQRWGAEYWQEFDQPKIIVPAITDTVNFAPDTTGYYSNDKTIIIVPDSVPYTLAILNSQVSLWLAQQTFASRQGGFFEFKPMYISELPIPTGTPETIRPIESISKALICMKGEGSSAAYFERLLNGLVYELFFPDELHSLNLWFFDMLANADLPRSAKQSDWEAFHEKVSDVNHPIYAALFALNGLEVVRIIEGRE